MIYRVQMPSSWPGSPGSVAEVKADTPEEAARKAFAGSLHMIFVNGTGYHVRATAVESVERESADAIKARGRVHPPPADELLITWRADGYAESYGGGEHTSRIALPKPLQTA